MSKVGCFYDLQKAKFLEIRTLIIINLLRGGLVLIKASSLPSLSRSKLKSISLIFCGFK